MSLEKIKIEDAIYDVISEEEYFRNPSMYSQYTAVRGNDGYVYPVRLSYRDNRPGFYPNCGVIHYKIPHGRESQSYSVGNIINFSDAETIQDVIKTQQKLISAERTILTTIDNVFVPEIGENDAPVMKALKQAIIDKHIDLDKYESRFGDNYNNDKRLMKKDNITLNKLTAICEHLDIVPTLTLRDANPDVPNPIGKTITVDLTTSGMDDMEGESND